MNTPPSTARIPDLAREALRAWQNQVRQNFFDADPHLAALLDHFGVRAIQSDLREFGAQCAGPLDELARETNRDEHLPQLRRWSAIGERIESIVFHPSYHAIGRAIYATGAMARYASPGQELESLTFLYLLSQNGEAGHCCPFACTAGMIKILRQAKDYPAEWMPRLLDPDYDTHYHAAQFLTEVQGGSDVGANAVTAHEMNGEWFIHGEKWFCSVADAHLFLLTARTAGPEAGTRGLTAFAVPRVSEHSNIPHFRIRRLKYKLGTRSMASAEIDFEGARAYPVGDFPTVMELVLNTSRLCNAICSTGFIQRAYREAHAYAIHRKAFGVPILDFPSVQQVVAELNAEAHGARALTFHLAALTDRLSAGNGTDAARAAFRMLVNLNKYWTSSTATRCIHRAIEVLGGNGAIEDFSVLPRLLRDSIVCEAWEGGHNVLCAQALRDAQRLALHRPMFEYLRTLTDDPTTLQRLDACEARWGRLVAMPPEAASRHIRPLVDELRPVVASLTLLSMADVGPVPAAAAAHLLMTSSRGYDPLDDSGLEHRLSVLTS